MDFSETLRRSTNGKTGKGYIDSGPSNEPCVVFLNDTDFFGPRSCEEGGTTADGIWVVGHFMKKKAKQMASICLLDQSEQDVPEKDVHMLNKQDRQEDGNSETRYICDEVTVIENPEKLELGDLVYGHFQNGLKLEDAALALFRGRVAAVNLVEKTCDICYDDRDYESAVPFAYVVRVLPNEPSTSWINGITITKQSKSKATGAVAKLATIVVDDKQIIRLHYSSSGETWRNKVARISALQLIFKEAKQNIPKDKCLPWPNNAASTLKRQSLSSEEKQTDQPKKKAKGTVTSTRKSSQRKPSSAVKTPNTSTKEGNADEFMTPVVRQPTRTGRLTVYKEEPVELDEDSDTAMDDSEYSGGKQKPHISTGTVRRTQRSTARKASRQLTVSRSDIPAVPDDVLRVAPLEPFPDCPRALATMNRMEGSTLEKVWWDDPFAAQELLCMNLVIRGKTPSVEFWKDLLTLVVYGPRRDDVFFPDPNRMEITTDYIFSLFRTKGILEDCCELFSEAFSDTEAFGDALLSHMVEDHYMAVNDMERETATDRINGTVHAKSCASRIFLEIIRFLLHKHVVDGDEPACLTGIFRRTPKECLCQAIQVAQSIWKLAPRSKTIAFHELTETWGSVLSYLAWWYGKTAGENADALADLLSDIANSAPLSFLFDIIDTLKPEIIPQVRPKLAERWGLSEEYNLCYSS